MFRYRPSVRKVPYWTSVSLGYSRLVPYIRVRISYLHSFTKLIIYITRGAISPAWSPVDWPQEVSKYVHVNEDCWLVVVHGSHACICICVANKITWLWIEVAVFLSLISVRFSCAVSRPSVPCSYVHTLHFLYLFDLLIFYLYPALTRILQSVHLALMQSAKLSWPHAIIYLVEIESKSKDIWYLHFGL